MRVRRGFYFGVALAAAIALALGTPDAGAYTDYTQSAGTGNCLTCHGDFRADPYMRQGVDQGWGTDLMDGHERVINDCGVCHGAGPFYPVSTTSSVGVGGEFTTSCLGCHGRFETALGSVESSGLRQHHWDAGVTLCDGCHPADSDPVVYVPVGEDVLPPNYDVTLSEVSQTDPCNPGGTGEDFAGDSAGLDNDGDNAYDGLDPDCAPLPTPSPTPPLATPTPTPVGPTPTPGPTGTPTMTPGPTPTPGPTGTPTATPGPTPTPGPAPLEKDQQKCVNAMNKDGEKVNKTQLKENEKCLKDFQKEKLTTSFDVCTTADRKGKVQKAEDKTVKDEAKKCTAPLPPFAYTGSAAVNAAGVNGALALTYDIFGGPPVLDASLITTNVNKDTAKCQTEMLKKANKVENTALKEINKAKKDAIKDPTITSDAALAQRLQAALSSNTKITKAGEKLVSGVEKKCATLQNPELTFPGACADVVLGVVSACVNRAARCEACLKIEAFDGLDLDCDVADDQIANMSCPLP